MYDELGLGNIGDTQRRIDQHISDGCYVFESRLLDLNNLFFFNQGRIRIIENGRRLARNF
jgi:hypothetical protein